MQVPKFQMFAPQMPPVQSALSHHWMLGCRPVCEMEATQHSYTDQLLQVGKSLPIGLWQTTHI